MGTSGSQHKVNGETHYERNRGKYLEKAKLRRRQTREWLNSIKDVPCYDCGVKYPPYVMHFDHKSDKVFNIGSKFSSVSMKNLLDEISKCDIVCANCHAERTHNRRDWCS